MRSPARAAFVEQVEPFLQLPLAGNGDSRVSAAPLGRCEASHERIEPMNAAKACEVGVARAELSPVLERECGQMGIAHEIPRCPQRLEQLAEKLTMTIP
jgi:hypothetical protein